MKCTSQTESMVMTHFQTPVLLHRLVEISSEIKLKDIIQGIKQYIKVVIKKTPQVLYSCTARLVFPLASLIIIASSVVFWCHSCKMRMTYLPHSAIGR